MFLESVGATELIVILVIALVVFGPAKLPELGKSLGSAIREFKKESANLTAEMTRAMNEEPAVAKPAPTAAPAAPKPEGGNSQSN